MWPGISPCWTGYVALRIASFHPFYLPVMFGSDRLCRSRNITFFHMSPDHLTTWLKGRMSLLVVVLYLNSSGITKCDRLLLQSGSGITKSDKLYYKVYQALQSLTVIRKWDVTPLKYTLIQMWKVRHSLRIFEYKKAK